MKISSNIKRVIIKYAPIKAKYGYADFETLHYLSDVLYNMETSNTLKEWLENLSYDDDESIKVGTEIYNNDKSIYNDLKENLLESEFEYIFNYAK